MSADDIISKIIADIRGRSALGNAWDDIDADIRNEIVAEWRTFFTISSESTRRWKPYPDEKPEANADSRHLVVLVNGDMHWIGIRSYDFSRACWHGRGNCADEHEEVWYFTPLLLTGERLPAVPNSVEQISGECGYPTELRWARTTR